MTRYELEKEILPEIRRDIVMINDEQTRTALFSLLGLVHDLAEELERTKRP